MVTNVRWGQARKEVKALWPEIQRMLDQGFSVRRIHSVLCESEKTTVAYSKFLLHVQKTLAALESSQHTVVHPDPTPEPQPALPSRAMSVRDDDTPVPGSDYQSVEKRPIQLSSIDPKAGAIFNPGATND